MWGSKDCYGVDRVFTDGLRKVYPEALRAVFTARDFSARAVSHFAENGVRQFVDLGAGFDPQTHLAAQKFDPPNEYEGRARTLYLENYVLAYIHGEAQWSTPRTHWSCTDITEPGAVFEAIATARDPDNRADPGISLSEPVVVCLVGTGDFLGHPDALGVVREVMEPLAPGSALIATATAADADPARMAEVARTWHLHGMDFEPSTLEEFGEYFEGLALMEPGIVPVHQWPRNDDLRNRITLAEIACYAGVGVKPGLTERPHAPWTT